MADAIANDEVLSLRDMNFMMAFTLESYFTGESFDDPRFVKWAASIVVSVDGVFEPREVPIFPCRDEDYAKFYPLDERSSPKLEQTLRDPNRELYCIDWEEANVELYGLESTGNFAFLQIAAVPCNQKLTHHMIGGLEDRIDKDCVWDLEK